MKLANLMLKNFEFSTKVVDFLRGLKKILGVEIQIRSHYLVHILLLLKLRLSLLVFLLKHVDLRGLKLDFFEGLPVSRVCVEGLNTVLFRIPLQRRYQILYLRCFSPTSFDLVFNLFLFVVLHLLLFLLASHKVLLFGPLTRC